MSRNEGERVENRVLLTGGTGFVGINIAKSLADNGFKVFVYSRRPMPDKAAAYLGDRVEWVQGSTLNSPALANVMQSKKISHVVHAAAVTPNEAREFDDMIPVVETNCIGTLRVAAAAASAGLKRFMYIGSVAIYGDVCQSMDPVPEDAPLNPRNTYEISKFASEKLVFRFAELHGLQAVSLRLGDVFGAGEHYSGVRDTMSAPYQAARCAVAGEKAVLPKDGSTGWIYAKDVGDAVAEMLLAKEWHYLTYNCCGAYRWSVKDFCEELMRYYPGFTYEVNQSKKGNVTFFSEKDNGMFITSRLQEDAGFTPRYDLKKSVQDYTEWLKRCPEMIVDAPERR